jgi:putative flippase GtrA
VNAQEQVAAPPLVPRLRRGARKASNWLQLLRFGLVGASGYLVNVSVFAVIVGVARIDYRAAATLAFLVAVTNNFVWNRTWTFRVQKGHVPNQAIRFLIVSVAGFLLNLGVLELLVSGWGSPELPAQAAAVALVMPANFLGNRLWTFQS